MGVEKENWCRSFCAIFDALFGRRHLSLKCLFRSATASLLAVALLWIILGAEPTLAARTDDTGAFRRSS